MRDPAAVIQCGVISSRMKFEGRRREPKLVRYVFSNHPEFKNKFNLVNHYADPETQGHTIEGGDVIVLSEKALAIGYSERTDKDAIMEIAKKVLADGPVERVYEVHLPAKRNFMHLDTVFTIIDENLVVTYPDAMNAVEYTVVYRKDGNGSDGSINLHEEKIEYSFIDQLKEEIPYPETVYTAGGHLDYASREQWYDGANVFALGPRKVISYNRNRHTNRALRQAGVEVLEINSSELSRGLGGPRCMTMPLKRKF
jgi:arginine deiminase